MLGPIGVFDSGYGGLTVLKSISETMPDYDYIYLGDNARTPYGTRSFDLVYSYTLEAVKKLFDMGCHLVIIACNTASAKALRSIQQNDLPSIDPARRVLGVIRPSVEAVASLSKSGHIGIMGTSGTVDSLSYPIEINKLHPHEELVVVQKACPMWVPIVENAEIDSKGAAYFVKRDIESLLVQDSEIDTIILACTHYPLLSFKIKEFIPSSIKLVEQGDIVAKSLKDYLYRHPEIDEKCSKGANIIYYTTEMAESFSEKASVFMNTDVLASHISL
jgi:glutamate racemase